MTVDGDSIFFGITTEDSSVGIFRYSGDGCSEVWIDSNLSLWTEVTNDITYYSKTLYPSWLDWTLTESPNAYSV